MTIVQHPGGIVNQPLDFTDVGRAKPAPQAPKKPRRKPKPPRSGRRSAPEKRTRLIAALVAVLVVGGAVFYLTRSDDKVPAAELADPKYCSLSTQLTSQLLAAGVPAEGDVPQTVGPDAIKPVLTQTGAQFSELQDSAPSELSDEVEIVVAAVRKAGEGDVSEIKSAGFLEAERAMVAFLRTPACGGSGGSSAGEQGS